MYSQSDILEMMQSLTGIISKNMENELDYYINMNGIYHIILAIYVQFLLQDAEKHNIILKAETTQVQNLYLQLI